MFATLAQAVRRTHEDLIDRLSVKLFFFVTRRAPLSFLRAFQRELAAEICERTAAQAAEIEHDQTRDA